MPGPDLWGSMIGPDLLVLLHRPDLRPGILHSMRSGILYGLYRFNRLYGLDLCPRIFLSRPCLKLLEQGFRRRLSDICFTGSFKSGITVVAL
jgi:hypothetical protein